MLLTTKLLVSAVAIAGQWPLIAALDSPTQQQQQQQRPIAFNDNVGTGGEGEWEVEEEEFWDGSAGKNPLTRDFRRKVVRWLGRWHVPGLAVGVVDGDDTWTQVGCFILLWVILKGKWCLGELQGWDMGCVLLSGRTGDGGDSWSGFGRERVMLLRRGAGEVLDGNIFVSWISIMPFAFDRCCLELVLSACPETSSSLMAGMAVLSRYSLDVDDSLQLCNLLVLIKPEDISLTFYL